ncbi:MAG: hypothetical protein GY769_20270 [bacterium]|nr:hypothetical protein [bacterium]
MTATQMAKLLTQLVATDELRVEFDFVGVGPAPGRLGVGCTITDIEEDVSVWSAGRTALQAFQTAVKHMEQGNYL